MAICAGNIRPWGNVICDGVDVGYFPTLCFWRGQTPFHLVEASKKLVKGMEYECGSESRTTIVRSVYTG